MFLSRLRRLLMALAAAALLLSSLEASSVWAQDEEEVDTDLLFRVNLDAAAVPAAPAFVRLVRILMEPGAVSPPHSHPGPEIARVEAGIVSVRVEGPARIRRIESDASGFQEAPVGEEFQLQRGEQIVYLPGTKMTFRNNGGEQARLLAAVILPGGENAPPGVVYDGAPPAPESFTGLTSQILGDGVASILPATGAQVSLERVRLAEEQDFPGDRNPMLVSHEDGEFRFQVVRGNAQVTRSAEPGPRSPLDEEAERSLAEGDAVFFPGGVGTADRNGFDALTFLRLTVSPGSGDERISAEDRATIRFVEEEREEEAEESAGEDEDSSAQDGETVYVNSNDVNVRAAPSSTGEVVATLQFGTPLRITGEAREGDGLRWIPVVSPDNAEIEGFIAEEFLSRQPDGSEPLTT